MRHGAFMDNVNWNQIYRNLWALIFFPNIVIFITSPEKKKNLKSELTCIAYMIEDLIRCKIIGKRELRRGREGWSLYESLLILIHLDYKRLLINLEYQWCWLWDHHQEPSRNLAIKITPNERLQPCVWKTSTLFPLDNPCVIFPIRKLQTSGPLNSVMRCVV